jgi:hypothetical protein
MCRSKKWVILQLKRSKSRPVYELSVEEQKVARWCERDEKEMEKLEDCQI